MSASEIVKILKKRDPVTFDGLRRTTVNSWIDRSGPRPQWTAAVRERITSNKGNTPGHDKGGRRGILVCNFADTESVLIDIFQSKYPDVTKKIVTELETLRGIGAPLTLLTIRGIMLATIIHMKPEILAVRFRDNSTFKASDSFLRSWLHGVMGWSMRKATQAAQKKPLDWEDQCERSAIRKAYLIKEHDIPASLWVNADQTQVVYAPGNRMTWTQTGSKDVSVVGVEEKRAFTLMVSVAANGTVLPFQAIYSGATHRSCPDPDAPFYTEAISAGFRLKFSGTKTYWSNQITMRSYVNNILAPYFEAEKERLTLPKTQKSLWQLDVWSVHRSEEFRTWMKKTHPTIILDFVPGGCTSVHQPCDVGIQRPLKLSIRRSYHEDIVEHIVRQMDNKQETITIDNRLPTVRNWSV